MAGPLQRIKYDKALKKWYLLRCTRVGVPIGTPEYFTKKMHAKRKAALNRNEHGWEAPIEIYKLDGTFQRKI